jgi:hypothetical protein
MEKIQCVHKLNVNKVITVKAVYVEDVDNWFLKLVLYNLNKYILKNPLSTC